MSTDVSARVRDMDFRETVSAEEGEERFAERRRIALMEPDAALRSVLVRTLLRLGCIVSFKRSPEQVIETLQEGPIDGTVVALDADTPWAAHMHAANLHQVPIVILSDAPPDPHLTKQLPSVRFLQKPFDMRDLLVHLHLPEKARIIRAG